MSVAQYQDTIYLIGGISHNRSLIKYNLTTENFTLNQSFFPAELYGYSQWWFQMSNELYMATPSGKIIRTYNLVTNQFNAHYSTVSFDSGVWPCVTGDPTQSLIYYLQFIVLSPNSNRTLQILNTSSVSWSLGPNMTIGRGMSSCIVSPTKIYMLLVDSILLFLSYRQLNIYRR